MCFPYVRDTLFKCNILLEKSRPHQKCNSKQKENLKATPTNDNKRSSIKQLSPSDYDLLV